MTVTIPQQHGPDQTLSSGAQVEERTEVRIETKDLPAGQTVDTWKVGNRIFSAHGNQISCSIHTADAEGGAITISYTTKNE